MPFEAPVISATFPSSRKSIGGDYGHAAVARRADLRRTLALVDERLFGKIGLVSDGVPAGGELTGEVMIEGQAYYALAADRHIAISKGTRVVVVEYLPPRTVVVTPM